MLIILCIILLIFILAVSLKSNFTKLGNIGITYNSDDPNVIKTMDQINKVLKVLQQNCKNNKEEIINTIKSIKGTDKVRPIKIEEFQYEIYNNTFCHLPDDIRDSLVELMNLIYTITHDKNEYVNISKMKKYYIDFINSIC